jgi:ubiquinone/menaquinone biosynthesis C-methylase UbiE
VNATVTQTLRNQHEVYHGQKIAENAEDIWGWEKPTGPHRLERRTGYLIERGDLTPEKLVLEIGCGTGVITTYLDRSGSRITGIDISEDLLSQAEAKSWSDRVDFQMGNAEHLHFEDETFDSIVGSSVLHHLDIEKSLAEIRRVLKPGGRMAFSEPNMINPHIFLQKHVPWFKKLAGDSPDETAFVRWQFANALRQAGFKDVQTLPYDFLHPLVPRPLIGAVAGLGSVIERIPGLREIAGSLIVSARKPQT